MWELSPNIKPKNSVFQPFSAFSQIQSSLKTDRGHADQAYAKLSLSQKGGSERHIIQTENTCKIMRWSFQRADRACIRNVFSCTFYPALMGPTIYIHHYNWKFVGKYTLAAKFISDCKCEFKRFLCLHKAVILGDCLVRTKNGQRENEVFKLKLTLVWFESDWSWYKGVVSPLETMRCSCFWFSHDVLLHVWYDEDT